MKILFFDGYCSVCNTFVDWGLKNDRTQAIQFASLQGETARQKIQDQKYLQDLNSVVYLRDGKIYDQSDAVLYFLKDTGSWASGLFLFLIVPKMIRDFIYSLFAKYRYSLFKKRDHCRIPTESEKKRLLG